jgi:hypothetical protein
MYSPGPASCLCLSPSDARDSSGNRYTHDAQFLYMWGRFQLVNIGPQRSIAPCWRGRLDVRL